MFWNFEIYLHDLPLPIGNQGDQWLPAQVSVPHKAGLAAFILLFEGVIGSGFRGDVAVDDIIITDGICPRLEEGKYIPWRKANTCVTEFCDNRRNWGIAVTGPALLKIVL